MSSFGRPPGDVDFRRRNRLAAGRPISAAESSFATRHRPKREPWRSSLAHSAARLPRAHALVSEAPAQAEVVAALLEDFDSDELAPEALEDEESDELDSDLDSEEPSALTLPARESVR